MIQSTLRQSLSDPTVWYPQGMHVQRETKSAEAVGGEDGIFIMFTGDLPALNRYLWTGSLLPTDRETYKIFLGIADGSEISDPVWSAADRVLATYTTIQGDTSEFLNSTWGRITDIASHIYNYAKNAGGDTSSSSYYSMMLQWVREYHDEANQENPDQDMLRSLKESILDITNIQIKNIEKLQSGAEDAKKALSDFHGSTMATQTALNNSTTEMKNLLDGEDGEIAVLTSRIEESLADIESYQQEIAADRQKIKETAYYVWIPIAGTIAGPVVASMAEAEIRRYENAIQTLRDTVEQDQVKLRSAVALKGDITSMDTQVSELVTCIGPAIQTIEGMQGSWDLMSSDLQGLHDLLEDQENDIPPVKMEEVELQNIREQWNYLRDHSQTYIMTSHNTDMPPRTTADDYLDQLQTIKKFVRKQQAASHQVTERQCREQLRTRDPVTQISGH